MHVWTRKTSYSGHMKIIQRDWINRTNTNIDTRWRHGVYCQYSKWEETWARYIKGTRQIRWHQLWIHTVKREPGRLIHEAYTMRCTAKPGFTFRENHRITIECVNPGECWNGLTHSSHQIIIHISTIPFQQNELAYYWRLITGLWRVVWVVYCLKWANSGIATVLIL